MSKSAAFTSNKHSKLCTEAELQESGLIYDIFQKLFKEYGPQHWWPAKTDLEIIIGAILTQSAAWSNVTKAIRNLETAKALDIKELQTIPEESLASLVRPSGYYNVKAKKIKSFVQYLCKYHNGSINALMNVRIDNLRNELLSIYGIGEETADSIILYVGKKPIFVVDAYTRRMYSRLGLTNTNIKYSELQQYFMTRLPTDVNLFQEYHALIVKHSSLSCKTKPTCNHCPLLTNCNEGKMNF